jgi:hypothetical protein
LIDIVVLMLAIVNHFWFHRFFDWYCGLMLVFVDRFWLRSFFYFR